VKKRLLLFGAVFICGGSTVFAGTSALDSLQSSSNALFVMLGAVMILAMHAGFAFLEVGTVRHKNQVNALNKILVDYSISTLIYFFIGYPLARGVKFMVSSQELMANNGIDLFNFFLFLGFAACIPAIISGGVAERTRFWPNTLAGAIFVGLLYPFIEGLLWGGGAGAFPDLQLWIQSTFGAGFADFAGSVIVHSTGGWLALPAVLLLGHRLKKNTIKPSSIPFLALGSWILIVGWFGFNVMSAGNINDMSGLVAINSLMAMVGGVIAALLLSKNDAGFVHNGALAGLVAVCAGSNLYHPAGALAVGAIAGALFVVMFEIETQKFKFDDVLGVWPLHGLCGTWGGIAAGIFGQKSLGGLGGVSFSAQLVISLAVAALALGAGFLVYGVIHKVIGLRFSSHQETVGSDLAVHRIEANPEDAI
jgi:Amt family ammonium transporter